MIVWHKTQWNVWNGKIGKVDIHCNIKSAVMISIRALTVDLLTDSDDSVWVTSAQWKDHKSSY